jgi:hypothetical protein
MALGLFNDSQQAAGWTLSVILAPICTIATVLRFVATKRAGRKIGWEDWYALLALLSFLPYCVYMIWSKSAAASWSQPHRAQTNERSPFYSVLAHQWPTPLDFHQN